MAKAKKKVGRPTKYDPKFIKSVEKYLEEHKDDVFDYHKTMGEKSDSYERRVQVKLPTLKGFARYIGVNESTIYEWDKTYPGFSKSLDDIRTEQHDRLVNAGLSGDYNPTIAKLVLSTNHGYSEKNEYTGKDGGPIEHAVTEMNDDQLAKLANNTGESRG